MPLLPVSKSAGVVAELAREDPVGAQELARLALYEVFSDLADSRVGDRIRKSIEAEADFRSDIARRTLVKSFIRKRAAGDDVTEVLKSAVDLTMIDVFAKGNPWDPREHPRDEHGRFTIKLRGKDAGERRDNAGHHVDAWVRQGKVKPGTPVTVKGSASSFYEIDENGEEQPVEQEVHGKAGEKGEGIKYENVPEDFDPHTLHVHSDDLEPTLQQANRQRVRTQAADLGREFIGAQQPQQGKITNPNRFSENLRQISGPDATNYSRLAVTGNAVRTLSPPGSPTRAAGAIAQVAGELGPEAERVLGPGLRRTAYRYRGTEKTPDAQLVREVASATDGSDAIGGGAQVQPDGSLARGTASYYARRNATAMPPDQLALRMRGDTATGYLINKIPDPEKASLSIAAGRVPPSQGVIIDRAGDVTTEAMGAGSDHYLPFDLKNLRDLNGGQYTRTRLAGGPTTEDLYTGLLGGARQFQVASNSGVFTVELDPSVRGTRRYSDKARNMIKRYQALLDRIHSSQEGGKDAIYTQDIPAATKAEITRNAYERAGWDKTLGQKYAEADLEEERQRMAFSGPSDDELEEAARNLVDGEIASGKQRAGSRQQYEMAVQDKFYGLLAKEQSKRVQRLQLDGEGYHKALQSLQEEFPYFIRSVDYQPLRSFSEGRSHGMTPGGPGRPPQGTPPRTGTPRVRDRGYVAPGQVTATDGYRMSTRRDDREGSGDTTAPSSNSPRTPNSPSGARELRPFSPMASADDAEDNLYTTQSAVLDAAGAIDRYGFGSDKDDEQHLDDRLRSGRADIWLQAYVGANGGWGPAVKKLLKDGTPDELKRAAQAIDDARDFAESNGSEVSAVESEKMDKAKQTLTTYLGRKVGAKEVADPVRYMPEDDTPAHFDEIASLGSNPENYANFLTAQRGTDFADAVRELESKSPEERRRDVAENVRRYARTEAYGRQASPEPRMENTLVGSHKEAQAVAELGDKHQLHRKLKAKQQAWAFLHQRDAIGGGAPAPKAPEQPQAGGPVPQFRMGDTTTPKSVVKKRRVIVHPPGSPVAEAFAKARMRTS